MKSFNLFSQSLRKQILDKSFVKLPSWLIGIIATLVLVGFLSLGAFFINFYYGVQLQEKGKQIITLSQDQNKYKTTLNNIDNYLARKAAISKVQKDRIYPEKIIGDIDSLTNNTATSYQIEKTSSILVVKGKVPDIDSANALVGKVRDSGKYQTVRLDQVVRVDKVYEYTILLTLKSETL